MVSREIESFFEWLSTLSVGWLVGCLLMAQGPEKDMLRQSTLSDIDGDCQWKTLWNQWRNGDSSERLFQKPEQNIYFSKKVFQSCKVIWLERINVLASFMEKESFLFFISLVLVLFINFRPWLPAENYFRILPHIYNACIQYLLISCQKRT